MGFFMTRPKYTFYFVYLFFFIILASHIYEDKYIYILCYILMVVLIYSIMYFMYKTAQNHNVGHIFVYLNT